MKKQEELYSFPQQNDGAVVETDIRMILLSELHDFNGHPFKVENDMRMGQLYSKAQEVNEEACYQIEVSKYVVKNYKTSKYYICSKCGRLTPYNVHNKCVQDKCDGILSEVDPDKALASNYYRRQYKTKKIESIVVKEHKFNLDCYYSQIVV